MPTCRASFRAAVAAVLVAGGARSGADELRVVTNGYTFGQAPVWDADGEHVVFHQDFGGGEQIYRSALDGSGIACITCAGRVKTPNMVPQVHPPHGDKILFHSWDGRVFTIGAPGFGGLGSELYVVNPDGTGETALTNDGEGEDDFHAYWSPDGRQLVWTHINWNFVTDGGRGRWDVRIADYVDDASGPHLENVSILRPDNGHFYETQWWAPDGSGFLYTESVDSSLDLELFFYRLHGSGPTIERLTDNPAWDEQAIFTPDMKRVLFMSTRDHPGFFNLYSNAAASTGIPAETDYLTILPIFEAGFLQPIAAEATDLYELDWTTRAVRRLTFDGDDGWIIPEFACDPSGRLLWTEQKYPDGVRVPLPPNPARQAAAAAASAGNPPPADAATLGHGGTPHFTTARTRIGNFVP